MIYIFENYDPYEHQNGVIVLQADTLAQAQQWLDDYTLQPNQWSLECIVPSQDSDITKLLYSTNASLKP